MPDYSVIESLCQVLKISVSELIAGKEKEPDTNISSNEEELALLSFKIEQLEKNKKTQIEANKKLKTGISFGSVLAVVISYTQWHSIGWAIFHGMLSWIYVIYYWLKY